MISENNLEKDNTNIISTLKEIYNRTIIDEFDKKFKDAQSPIDEMKEVIDSQGKMLKRITTSMNSISENINEILESDNEEDFSKIDEKLDNNIKLTRILIKNQKDLQEEFSIAEQKIDNNLELTSTLSSRSTKLHNELVELKSQLSDIEESFLSNKKEINKNLVMIIDDLNRSIKYIQKVEHTKDSQLQNLTTEVEKLCENEIMLNNKIKKLSFIAYALILFEIVQIVLHFV
ncbi:hypothetical protein ETI06_00240 [Macrococcoides goetzii]|nr:hypothetical protein [Macrococcus goetzii]TDM50439.1 hypothetical protein ETI06_00240 [Macrococcus goetzii]